MFLLEGGLRASVPFGLGVALMMLDGAWYCRKVLSCDCHLLLWRFPGLLPLSTGKGRNFRKKIIAHAILYEMHRTHALRRVGRAHPTKAQSNRDEGDRSKPLFFALILFIPFKPVNSPLVLVFFARCAGLSYFASTVGSSCRVDQALFSRTTCNARLLETE